METKLIAALTVLVIVAIGASVGVYLIVSQPAEPSNPKAEYKTLIEKAKNMPNSKIVYGLEIRASYLGSMSMSITADITRYVLSPKREKTSMTMEYMGYAIGADFYTMDGKTILCSEASGFLAEPKTVCRPLSEKDKAVFPGAGTSYADIDKILKDFNISFAGERTIAKRSTKCFNIEATGADLNLSSSTGLFSLTGSVKQEVTKPKMPTGFTILPGSTLPKDTAISLFICLDNEYGFLTLMDLNFVYKQKYAKKPLTATITMELKSFELGVVTEKDLELPVAFSVDRANCRKKEVKLSITPYKDISGDIKVTISKRAYIGEEESKLAVKTIKDVQLKAFEGKDLNITLDKSLESGSANIEVCINDECQSSYCYISIFTPSRFYARAKCEPNKATITITPYENFSGDVNITLYKEEYDHNTYEFKKFAIASKIFPNVKMESGKKKTFFLETAETLESGKDYPAEICIDDECYNTTCYVSYYYTPAPTPKIIPTKDINAKMQDCLTRITVPEGQVKCLIQVFNKSKYSPDTCTKLAPLCDKLKELVWKYKDSLRDYGAKSTNIGFFEVPECYAYYAYYSNLTDKECDKLSGYVISYGEFTLAWQSYCKQKFAFLVGRGY
ncbi:MAG: hypothetical protein J7L44_02365 [Candidatus Diapherotrites archaeon]|nr:hypothetical protein [Candidatus Diapherotrites archaeon]